MIFSSAFCCTDATFARWKATWSIVMAFCLSEKPILNAAIKAICQEMRLQFAVVESFMQKEKVSSVVQTRTTFMCLLVKFAAIQSKRRSNTQLDSAIRAVRSIRTTSIAIKFAVRINSLLGTFTRLSRI